MSNYLGDFAVGSTVHVPFTTHDKNGGIIAPSSAFEAQDFSIYKNFDVVQRLSVSGIGINSPFDAVVGAHLYRMDTSDNDDPGFWAAGNDYMVMLNPDETVDLEDPTKFIATFSIENRHKEVDVTTWLGTAVPSPDTAGIPEVNLANVTTHGGSAARLTLERMIVASTTSGEPAVRLTGDAASGAGMEILGGTTNANGLALSSTGTGKDLALIAGGAAALTAGIIVPATFAAGAIDAAAIAANAIGSSELSTTAAQKIRDEIVTAKINVTAGVIDTVAALAAGAITNATFAAGAIDATAIANGAIDAATFAAGAIDAAALATDAVEEIRDSILTTAQTEEPTATAPPNNPSLKQMAMYIYMAWRNDNEATATERRLKNNAGTVIAKATMADDATTFNQGEMAAGP